MRYGRLGGPISVMVSNYVCVAIRKSEVRLTSFSLVQSLTVFLVVKVAGSTCGQIRWPNFEERLASKVSYRDIICIGGSKWPLLRPGVCFRFR